MAQPEGMETMTAARAVALILAWVRRERAKAIACRDEYAEERCGKVATLDSIEMYILGLLPGGGEK